MSTITLKRNAIALGLAGLTGLGAVAGTVASADASTTSGCRPTTCVSSLSLVPGPKSISADLETKVKTKAKFAVYSAGKKLVQLKDSNLSKSHLLETGDHLQPNTVYDYVLKLKDSHGHKVTKVGTMNTLHREVTVLFDNVTVANDSDASGPGEFKVWSGIPTDYSAYFMTPVVKNSGDTFPLIQGFTQDEAGAATLARTEMYDDDFADQGLPGSFPNDPSWTTGSSPQGQWATASTVLDTRNATDGLEPFQMTVDNGISFVVHGHYSVKFVD